MIHTIEQQQIQRANATMRQALEALERMKFRLQKQRQHAMAEMEARANAEQWTTEKRQQYMHAIDERTEELRTMYQLLTTCNELATDQHHWRAEAFTHGMQYGMEAHRHDPLMPTDEEIDTMDADELITLMYARTWRAIFPQMNPQLCLYMATYHPTEYIDIIYTQINKNGY